MDELELELTYLIKQLPANLKDLEKAELLDLYFPADSKHPKVRLRKNGNNLSLTKKLPVNEGNASVQTEQTIVLDEQEFKVFKTLPGKMIHKYRYKCPYNGKIAEIDIFTDDLTGLVLVDFEFESEQEKEEFKIPDFCLADVTQELFIAGGYLAGKSYQDIEEELKRYNYQPILP